MQTLIDSQTMQARLADLAQRILADPAVQARGVGELAIIGIRRRGEVLGARLARLIEQSSGTPIDTGALDITMYRDDLSGARGITVPEGTDIPFALDDRVVVLVDDVLYTGRSVRAALDALVDFGRPKVIRLVVLVDRGGRELPISADYVGISVPPSARNRIEVLLRPTDAQDVVTMIDAEAP